jgi:hemin uptake protein HemP
MPTPSDPTSVPTRRDASAGDAARNTATDEARRGRRTRWDTASLFAGAHEIEIQHAGAVYRLRITSLGKLILTK